MSKDIPQTRDDFMLLMKELTGHNNLVSIPKVFIKMTGDLNRAALLNQILYWSGKYPQRGGWFYKSYSEWEDELGLTQYQVKRAIDGDKRAKDNSQCLSNFGVETKLKKAEGAPTLHYRINNAVFKQCLLSFMNNVDNPNSTKSTMENEQSQQSMENEQSQQSITKKSTTEITTENIAPSSDNAPTPSNKPVISQAPVVSQVTHSVSQDAATLSSSDYERMMQLIVTIPSITKSLQHKLFHVLRGTTKKGGWGYEQSQFMVATPMTPDELCEFQKWMRKHQSDIYASMKSPVTILSWVEQYRQARDAYLASQIVTAQAEAISSEFYV